jgi:hypothetical protein
MHLTLESVLEIEATINRQRATGDFQASLDYVDGWLQKAFGEDADDEDIGRLALVGVLASQKSGLLQDIEAAMLVIQEDDGGQRVQPALDPERRREFAEQAINWAQVAMAACQRALSLQQGNAAAPWASLIHHQLTNVRRGFLQASNSEARPLLAAHLPLVRHLFSLLWLRRDLAGAEDLLYLLAELEGKEQIKVTALSFYRELLGLDDARLEAGGLPRAEIAQALPDWE